MATAPRHKGDRSSALLLKKGQEFYIREEYKHAEKAFSKAMALCHCGTNVLKQACIADAILAGIKEKDLKAVLAKMSAHSRRCDNRVHVDALDSLIATYEVLGQLDECLSLAAKMVNLCPREPQAYLRLGKILRLKEQPTLAYFAYNQGVELAHRKQPNHAGLHKLRVQRDKVKSRATFDPIATLPVELVYMIFKLVDFRLLCRCLSVSKDWKAVLTSPGAKALWHVQTYQLTQPCRGLRASFEAYSRYAAGGIKELSIDGCAYFFKRFPFARAVFLSSQHLKVLKLGTSQPACDLLALPLRIKPPQLTSLSLSSGIHVDASLLLQLIKASSNSLEELSVFDLPHADVQDGWYPGWPTLEKLKVVRFSYPRYRTAFQPYTVMEHCPLSLNSFMDLAPNVEVVWFDHLKYNPNQLMSRWSKLRSVFIGGRAVSPGIELSRTGPSVVQDIREVHLEGFCLRERFSMRPRPSIVNNPTAPLVLTVLVPLADIPHLQSLEKLSLLSRMPMCKSDFELIVRPSMESGTLRELDIRPLPFDVFIGEDGRFQVPDWFKSKAITYLSLTGFTKEHLYKHKGFDEVMLDLIDRFPNLCSVDVSNELVPDYLLAKFIQKGVKEIYHRGGASKIDLQLWAAKHGAKVASTPPLHLPSLQQGRDGFFNDYLQFPSTPVA
ncbi:hypothetical protein F4677DRAFT_448933 [Hypoxylon crocopeplum]|nr:hypothetical protein F4677DRAFT_448933 [Hypoxylon crocopeplum]